MSQPNIELIVCDLDGTLLATHDGIHRKDEQVIQRYRELGGKFIISTGRPAISGEIVAHHLQLQYPCVYANGALCKHPQTGEVIFALPADTESLKELTTILQQEQIDSEFYTIDRYLTEKMTELIEDHAYQLGVEPYQSKIQPEIADPQKFLSQKENTIIKCNVLGRSEQTRQRVNELAQQFIGRLRFEHSRGHDPKEHDRDFWNVTNLQASKGTALQAILKKLKMKPENVMAIGDSTNDLTLFDVAGLKVAMGNATEAMKERADYVTAHVDQCGVAEAIEKFCL